ncbi:MAG TPA: gliding motility-associated C-terminal domain-containing protein [Saprospiraceae bacterium]|nr:gliding motility-associated C-terminal domain-containing protein [Saprospiraceae bacterium]
MLLQFIFAVLMNPWVRPTTDPPVRQLAGNHHPTVITNNPDLLICNCTITQDGNTYPISSLIGNESAPAFYEYGIPAGSSANTGLELENALILFLYEDMNTGVISLFLIADIQNSGSGGTLSFEFNCAPAGSFLSVTDDPGEFAGSPPLFTGNWSWSTCCTDGGVIENIGCNTNMNLDLLVSSGIDSIVWLTGDITDPDHILLSLTGEAITINCGGGGICCPVDLDTDVTKVDASCASSTNGSISLNPQDGLPPYTYDWSTGDMTSMITDLAPNVYSVTVTDAQGCTEEIQVTIGFMMQPPNASPASIDVCSNNAQDEFDLTTIEDIVNQGTGFDVLWFENADQTGAILFPDTYTTSGTTVYALVENNGCHSMIVPVMLTLYPLPPAFPTSLTLCEEFNDIGIFDLTEGDQDISNGGGDVLWFLSSNLTGPLLMPTSFTSPSQTIYAVVDDGHCYSEVVEVELIVLQKPEGDPANMHLCSDAFDQAEFDLIGLEPGIYNGFGTIQWYLEQDLFDLITSPAAFITTTTTVYVVISEGMCISDPIPVQLIVDPIPVGTPVALQACDDGSDMAVFDLTAYDIPVGGGVGGVDWFLDLQLNDPVQNPTAFTTGTTIVYAVIDNGTCQSEPVPVNLNVTQSPVGIPASIETCAEPSGQGLFNLTALDGTVNGGIGIVTWYEDALGAVQILLPASYMSGNHIVYAQISDNGCLSQFIPVTLTIVNSVTANPAQMSICDDGTGMALFDLSTIETNVNGGSGIVHWYSDQGATMILGVPNMFLSGTATVYAQVTAGTCISSVVSVNLIVLPTPVATPTINNYCGDVNGQLNIDLTTLENSISGGSGTVSWFWDALMTMSISSPGNISTGDSILYANVSNGSCSSGVVTVEINIATEPVANLAIIEECVPFGQPTIVDLTQYDLTVGTGALVRWYTDATGLNEIIDPSQFLWTTGQSVYAIASVGFCSSAIVQIDPDILEQPEASTLNIEKCGDPSGQITLDLTEVDSLISGHTGNVVWYSDPSATIPLPAPDNFLTGNTIVYATVENGFCITAPVAVNINIVNSLSANPIDITICKIDDVTSVIDLRQYDIDISSGNGVVTWFMDAAGVNAIANTNAFLSDGATLFAMVSEDGCVSPLVPVTISFEIATTPVLSCAFTNGDSISIVWTGDATQYEIEYAINGIGIGGAVIVTGQVFNLGSLEHGDKVTLIVTSLYGSACMTSLTNEIECETEDCPAASLSITQPGIICIQSDPFQIEYSIVGPLINPVVTFSGLGIINSSGIFDPALTNGNSPNTINAIMEAGGCTYTESFVIAISTPDTASFLVRGTPCVDSILEVRFNGFAWSSSTMHWFFNGANVTPIVIDPNSVRDYDINWSEPGSYELSLWTAERFGCISDTFVYPITIDAPLEAPDLTCIAEDYYSLTIGWDPVDDATSYVATTSEGTGKITGTSYTVSNLPDNTIVDITVQAIGSTCGEPVSSIQCQTLDYIEPHYFIPDVFSPGDDGINDIFFIQSNVAITEVSTFRIFDRWGNLLFEDQNFLPNDPAHGWDGKFSGKMVNPGVYLYWAEVKRSDGEVIRKSGDVTVIR